MTRKDSNRRRAAMLAACCLALLLGMVASVLFGATRYGWSVAWDAAFRYDENAVQQMIVRTTRMPRAFMAASIGASLAIAGALMQTLTRNPLASPGVLGINSGASFVVVTATLLFSVASMQALAWLAFAGAAAAAGAVYLLSSLGREAMTPMKIVLAGSALTALFSSFTQAILVLNQQGLNSVLYWLTGTIAGRSTDMLRTVLPYMAACWIGAWLISRDLNVLLMGEDASKGLGQRTAWLKTIAGLIVVVLAGGAISVAGPIGFIGVVVPHLARHLSGHDHRWLIPFSGVLGALLLVAADLAARFILIPEEVPVGVMTALVGVPFFFYLARRRAGSA
ncbi:iron ABC transporter permease [Cohnella xylanilytica]|uniref:Iron ABC transporter permease n=1 Tax=Cohnella xylanilytica TaxID=557555 RepID=A0A841UBC8_9BACL|nr:iron ABC transporter permease [Cohnella xylanilytica]MBB6695261.1 iron ABC transporter permease [Cohnella xylanilytica]